MMNLQMSPAGIRTAVVSTPDLSPVSVFSDNCFSWWTHCTTQTQTQHHINTRYTILQLKNYLPRCMECRRGLAIRILSVCLFVRLSNACIVTKQKKNLSRFLYNAKDYLAWFSENKNVVSGRQPLLPE